MTDVDTQDGMGWTRLIRSAWGRDYDECRSLLQRGGLDLAAEEKKYPVLGR